MPIAAAALGAALVEKHFTLSREMEGPDHPFALEPDELRAMVAGIRDAQAALGDGRKEGPNEQEREEMYTQRPPQPDRHPRPARRDRARART